MFTLTQADRESVLLPQLIELTEHHRLHCPEYARILDALGHPAGHRYRRIADLPWLPVRLFKRYALRSIAADEVFGVLTSSGTTGERSRIYLDRAAAADQQRMLAQTLAAVIGPRRMPMLIVDSRSVLDRGGPLSTRRAAVLGMMTYGTRHTFLLDATGALDLAAVRGFLAEHGHQPFLVYGFTAMVWTWLRATARDPSVDLGNAILIHSGGWKTLAHEGVDNAEFRRQLAAAGVRRVHNFYGMAEQIGTIFLEGTGGFYCPDFADVIVRDPATWSEVPPGTPGVVQVISTLPRSYPGHLLLTEDTGVVHGVDDGDRPGKRFSVLGRLPRAEPRGCSDVPAGSG